MKKRNYLYLIVTLLSLVFCFTACGSSKNSDASAEAVTETEAYGISTARNVVENAEKDLNSLATEVGEEFKEAHVKQEELFIEKKDDRFLIYPKSRLDKAFTLLYPSNFFDEQESELLDMKNIKQYEKGDTYKIAENLAINYVKFSSYIKEEDRQGAIDYVKNIQLYLADFEQPDIDQDLGYVMLTEENRIYIDRNLVDYIHVYTYLHELIHVVSNYTNNGTLYEKSSYRYSAFNEAMTDLICRCLADQAGLEEYEYTSYLNYYQFALIAIDKFGDKMIQTYFYSDGYEAIKNSLPENQWDVYILLVENSDGDAVDAVNAYMVNEWYD